MAKFWVNPTTNEKLFFGSDFANVPGLVLVDFADEESAGEVVEAVSNPDRDALAAAYKEKFGRSPHPAMKIETLQTAVEGTEEEIVPAAA